MASFIHIKHVVISQTDNAVYIYKKNSIHYYYVQEGISL